MPLSRLALPSFTLVLMSPAGTAGEEPRALAILNDGSAATRTVRLTLPPPSPRAHSRGNDDLMRTVDTRFTGGLEYEVVYSQKGEGPVSEDDEDCESAAGTIPESNSAAYEEPAPGFASGRPRTSALRRFLAVKILRSFWLRLRRLSANVFCGTVQ